MQETQTLFECKENTTIKETAKYTIHGREGAFFFKNTLHFHQKVSQKHKKIKIESLEQGLPGTA